MNGGTNDHRVLAAKQELEAAEEAVEADPDNLELEQALRSAAKGLEEAIAAAKRTSLGMASGGGALAPSP